MPLAVPEVRYLFFFHKTRNYVMLQIVYINLQYENHNGLHDV